MYDVCMYVYTDKHICIYVYKDYLQCSFLKDFMKLQCKL